MKAAEVELCNFKGDICPAADANEVKLRPLITALADVAEAADVKGCSDEVRLDRIDKALSALERLLGEGEK